MHYEAERDERLMTLVAAAFALPADGRENFLQIACHDDVQLWQAAAEVLRWEGLMGDFLRKPLVELIDLEEIENPFSSGELIAQRFEIIRNIGEGGMGVVYEAFDRKRNQRIAIKCAKPGFGRLLSPELEGALKVRHPNICLVNEIHTTNTDIGDLDFLTMEYLEGETLAARIAREGSLPDNETVEIAAQLCAGLQEAHRSGILHRDLKASNIILCRTTQGALRTVITDFGLAANNDATTLGLTGGTPSYMAPETWQGQPPSIAFDIYSLGVVLYEMVCGQLPFLEFPQPATGPKLPVPPSQLLQRHGRKWDQVILPCLAVQPQDRPQNAGELLAILNRKPLYLRPVMAMAIFGLLATGSVLWRPIISYFRPADIRVALLPAEAPASLGKSGEAVIRDIRDHIKSLAPISNTTVSVVGPIEGVSTPKSAKTLLRANRALQIIFQQYGQDLIVHASLVELDTLTIVQDFQGRYSPANFVDIPAAVTGAVAPALRLRTNEPETVTSDAGRSYGEAMELLDRDEYSFDSAISLLQQAAHRTPHSPLPLAGLVEALVQKYRATNNEQWLRDANETASRAQALNPDSVAVLLALGRLELVQSHYEKALENYARVEELASGNVEVLLRRAAVYNAQDHRERALECYRRAVELAPQNYKTYKNFGKFYYAQGQYTEAAEEFRSAIERFPDDYEAYTDLGAALNDLQKDEEAEAALKKSLDIKKTARAWNSLGAIKAYQRHDALALTFYNNALTLSKNNFIYLMNMADSSRRLGQLRQARIYYRKSMELASAELVRNFRNGFVRVYVGYLAARVGQSKRAELEILQALQSLPKDKTVIRRTILTYEALGKREKAIEIAATAPVGVLHELNRQPDMAELSKDLRFKVLMVKNLKGD